MNTYIKESRKSTYQRFKNMDWIVSRGIKRIDDWWNERSNSAYSNR